MLTPTRWWAGLLLLALGCNPPTQTSPEPSGSSADPAPTSTAIPGTMVGSTWPVAMADDALRAPFEAHPGWAALVMQRDYPSALAAFGGEAALGVGQARIHMELAAAYRQALLVGANATVQVYGENRRDEDPPEVDCLLVVSYALLGQPDPVADRMDACATSGQAEPIAHARAWSAWSTSGDWPPTAALAVTPGQPGEPTAGSLPDAGALPHWTAKDLVEGLDVRMSSPAGLLGLALFHEGAAVAAQPSAEPAIRALLAPWRLAAEPVSVPSVELELPLELLFGSTLLVPADAGFLADVTRGAGSAALDGWKTDSALAAAVAPCFDAAGPAVDVGCVNEVAGRTFDQLRTAMEIRSGGEQGYHRPFAELGRLGVVRAGEALAASIGDEKSTGLLRLEALDLSIGTSAEPHYLLSIAAWDAGNRNSSRASDALHAQVGHIPGVEVARFPLDALHVRLSRESAPGVPMH
jgi:hypothetical protein